MAPVAAGAAGVRVGDGDIGSGYLLSDPAAGGFGLNQTGDRRNRLSYLQYSFVESLRRFVS